jgi:hypothetical protein
MHSTLKLRDSDPHDDFAIVPEVVPAAWADKVLADITRDDGVHPEVKRSADGRSPASDRQASAASVVAVAAPTVDARFRATATDDSSAPVEQPSTSRWVKSAVLLVFAIGSAAAAAAWQNHGDAARQMISNWVPAFAVTSSPPTETAALAEQPDAPAAQPVAAEQTPEPAAAEQTPEPAAAPAQPPESAAPAAAASSPDTLQLESMARDLAAMAQQVEQLKASIAELKTSQQAMLHEAAKAAEVKAAEVKPAEIKPAGPKPRPRISARSPRAAAAPPPRPLPAYPAAAPAPSQQPAPPPVSMLPAPPPPQAATRTEDGELIVRPPMPLR